MNMVKVANGVKSPMILGQKVLNNNRIRDKVKNLRMIGCIEHKLWTRGQRIQIRNI